VINGSKPQGLAWNHGYNASTSFPLAPGPASKVTQLDLSSDHLKTGQPGEKAQATNLRHRSCYKITGMRLNELSEKSRIVLKALAKGLSYEQILAANRGLTAHDFFRALSESPPGFWNATPGSNTNGRSADGYSRLSRLYVQ
jgi:hypothetical protein